MTTNDKLADEIQKLADLSQSKYVAVHLDLCDDIIAALRAERPQLGELVMVPKEPTGEILHAICDKLFTTEWADEGQTFQERCLADAKDLYRAMLAAAEAETKVKP